MLNISGGYTKQMEKYVAATAGLKVQHKKEAAPGRLLLKMILISSFKKKIHTEVSVVLIQLPVEDQTILIKMTIKFLNALPEEYSSVEAVKQMVINETYFMVTL